MGLVGHILWYISLTVYIGWACNDILTSHYLWTSFSFWPYSLVLLNCVLFCVFYVFVICVYSQVGYDLLWTFPWKNMIFECMLLEFFPEKCMTLWYYGLYLLCFVLYLFMPYDHAMYFIFSGFTHATVYLAVPNIVLKWLRHKLHDFYLCCMFSFIVKLLYVNNEKNCLKKGIWFQVIFDVFLLLFWCNLMIYISLAIKFATFCS